MSHQNEKLKTMLSQTTVIPVMVIERIEDALPMARALVQGGLKVLEITLRTKCALEAVRKIIIEVPEAVVGVGTVNTAAQFRASYEAGAAFAVSPGATDDLIAVANEVALPYLPGIATPSEAMSLRAKGYKYLKLFPAEVVGGRKMLKALNGPLSDILFCPTGGIGPALAGDYLSLPNVICVGGSWMLDTSDIETGNWHKITQLAHEASSLKG